LLSPYVAFHTPALEATFITYPRYCLHAHRQVRQSFVKIKIKTARRRRCRLLLLILDYTEKQAFIPCHFIFKNFKIEIEYSWEFKRKTEKTGA
jgi:hypothetical protein